MAVDYGREPFSPSAQKAMRGQVACLSGRAAEDQVASDYLRRGYALAATRWRGHSGEVDLIFADGDGFIFVEVKKSRSFARSAERLSPAQMQRVCAAAEEYLAHRELSQMTDLRFDVALVDGAGAIEVLENAFGHF